MTRSNWFSEQFEQFRNDPDYNAGLLRMKLYEDILRIMEEQGITRTQLATRLSCSKAYVTKLFNDSTNVTIHTLVRLALALGCDVELTLRQRNTIAAAKRVRPSVRSNTSSALRRTTNVK